MPKTTVIMSHHIYIYIYAQSFMMQVEESRQEPETRGAYVPARAHSSATAFSIVYEMCLVKHTRYLGIKSTRYQVRINT